MRVFEEQFFKVSIWGILPVFLAFIVFLCTVLIKCMKKEVLSPIEEFCDKKKFHKTEKIYSKVVYLSDIYFLVCVTLAIIPFVILFNARYDSYIYEMIKKIEVVSTIVIGLTTIAIAMAVVIILFDKRYYIVFSIREVLQKYKFSECLIVVIICCILAAGTTMTLLNGEIDSCFDVARFMILEIAAVYNIVGVTYILCVIINIMFLERKNELCLLGQLYRRFWLHRIDTIHFKSKKNWSKEAVEINIEYLIERYINICRRKKIARIKDIEFVTTVDCYKEKWYGKARIKFVRMMIYLLFISTIIDSIVLQENCLGAILFNVIVTTISIIIAYANIQSFRLVIMRFYSDTWGYYMHTNDNKELLIPRAALRKNNIYDKYIMRMKSLNAFFYIWINYVDKKKSTIKYEFEEVILGLEELDNRNMVTYFPIFTIGFFLFDKDIKIKKIKDIYNEMVVVENKQYSFERMLHSQIFYLTKNFNKEVFEYRSRLNEYLKWIES